MTTPLEDPTYTPLHPPVNGIVPPVVEKWGPRSQLRWFERFARELKDQPSAFWARFYCNSLLHKGTHCISCMGDEWLGYDYDIDERRCCCYALHYNEFG